MISFKNLIGKKETPPPAGTTSANPGAAPSASAPRSAGIFGQPLNVGQAVKSRKEEYIVGKNMKRAYLTLAASFLALSLYSVFFLYSNTLAYLKAPAEIADTQNQIEEYKNVIIPGLEKTKELHKAAYDKEFEETIAALQEVFPETMDKLGIVRLFESFATEVAAAYPPFEFTSITLAAPQPRDGYTVIPVSTSIYSSLAGFDKFLSLVDHSGTIYTGEGEDKKLVEKPVRLMSISNISVKYRGADPVTGKDLGVDFSVKLNIYTRGQVAQAKKTTPQPTTELD